MIRALANLPQILIVDDEATNLHLLNEVLRSDYRLLFAKTGATALDLARSERPDLVLLDVMMPGMTGYEVCRALKADPRTRGIPVIFVSALTDSDDEVRGFEVGGVDYIGKPISPPIVRARVRTHLSLVEADQLRRTQLQVVQILGRAAEYKDNETGRHVIRVSQYARLLAVAIGLSDAEADELLIATPMHDVGKIGVPDHILQKNGALTPEERKVMERHALMGAEIIGDHEDGTLSTARTIALSHHERWDGSGYPVGLAGEDIPLVGRIVAIADVFDALATARPYKAAWTPEAAFGYLADQRGRHFDPALVDAFLAQKEAVAFIHEIWKE